MTVSRYFQILQFITVALTLNLKTIQVFADLYPWSEAPLDIELKTGEERRISIPDALSLRVGVPDEFTDRLSVQVIGNNLWVTPLEQFALARIVVIAEPIGRLILELSATSEGPSYDPITIKQEKLRGNINPTETSSYGYVALTRWVIQKLYSPERLIKSLPGVVRIPTSKAPVNLFRCGFRLPTLCADGVHSIPIASWQSSKYFITAIHIKNNLEEAVVLDPRELIGNWRAASFVHARLQPRGHTGDNTVLIAISDFPMMSKEF